MSTRPPKPHILIAGAGIGGLTAALALLKRGYDVDVYEQAPELREVGAGLQISPNGNRVLHELGVLQAFLALACEAEGKEIRLWNTGQTWRIHDLGQESVARYGFPYCTAYRPDLLAVLVEGMQREKPNAIHLNCKCDGFTQDAHGVTLKFETGEARADALIGADGVHSKIRQALFGNDKPEYTGMLSWRGVIPMEKLPQHMRRKIGSNWVGPGGHVVHYPVHRGEYMNMNGIIEIDHWEDESWSARGTHEECHACFKGWGPDVHAMIDNFATPFKWALFNREPLTQWSVGRVSLTGDACHSMLPMLAQGGVMALEDGYVLARALEAAGGDIEQGLKRYERARIVRTTKVVLGSAENGRRFQSRTLANAEEAEAYVNREWQPEKVRARYDWLFTYDVTAVGV
ncbi:MAG: monooxygenase [Betaproteobacteria bacterium]|nr:monooxygenase [Betaproteobacteria bacterium]